MSLLSAEPLNLVAPLDFLAIRPPSITFDVPTFEVELFPAPTEPDFLLAARKLAQDHTDMAGPRARLAQAELAANQRDEAVEAARRALPLASSQGDQPAGVASIQVLLAAGITGESEQAALSLPKSDARSILLSRLAVLKGDLNAAAAAVADVQTLVALTL